MIIIITATTITTLFSILYVSSLTTLVAYPSMEIIIKSLSPILHQLQILHHYPVTTTTTTIAIMISAIRTTSSPTIAKTAKPTTTIIIITKSATIIVNDNDNINQF